MSEQDGGPAFPHEVVERGYDSEYRYTVAGMSLRDWFAGQALTGLLAMLAFGPGIENYAQATASEAYRVADAMLKEGKQ